MPHAIGEANPRLGMLKVAIECLPRFAACPGVHQTTLEDQTLNLIGDRTGLIKVESPDLAIVTLRHRSLVIVTEAQIHCQP